MENFISSEYHRLTFRHSQRNALPHPVVVSLFRPDELLAHLGLIAFFYDADALEKTAVSRFLRNLAQLYDT